MIVGIIAFILGAIRYKTKPYVTNKAKVQTITHAPGVGAVFASVATTGHDAPAAEPRVVEIVDDPNALPQLTALPRIQAAPDTPPTESFAKAKYHAKKVPHYFKTGFGAFLNSKFVRFIDDKIIGQEPRDAKVLDVDGLGIPNYVKIRKPGTGLFGLAEFFSTSFFAIAGFATALKLLSEKFNSDVHSWKGLQKDPGAFFKLKELFKNEKQSISPIEELFLLNALVRIEPKITFKDITGLAAQKKELEAIINYLLNPERYENTGTGVETGYLFHGPTGTGKTQLAEALAGELILRYKKPLAFFKIRGSELRYVGIKKVFDTVKKYAPCICFIDEIDLLNLQRDQNTSLLDEFLTSMKSDDNSRRVIILGATNRIDHIDHALLRPGRFGKIIIFENPTLDERKEFFKNELLGKNIYDPFLDMDKLGQETENCSFADLASIVNDAVAQATQRQQKLSYSHFDSAIDNFKRRIGDVQDISIPAEERLLIATHLAGHALGFALLSTSETLHKVTMLPIQKRVAEEKVWLSDLTTAKKITYFGDVFTLHKTNTAGFDTPEQKINMVRVLLAGHIAEKILLGSTSYSYHNEDNAKARNILESLALKGTKKEQHSKQEYAKILDEVSQLFSKYEAETTEFLMQNKELLSKLRHNLLDRTTLTNQDVQALILESNKSLAAAAA